MRRRLKKLLDKSQILLSSFDEVAEPATSLMLEIAPEIIRTPDPLFFPRIQRIAFLIPGPRPRNPEKHQVGKLLGDKISCFRIEACISLSVITGKQVRVR